MFADPLIASMTMQILCFFGMVVIFIFIARALSAMSAEMREAFRKQQMFLSDLERQILDLNFAARRQAGEDTEQTAPGAGGDDLLSLLENAARNGSPLPLDGGGQGKVKAADEYDPAKDPDLFDDAYGSGSGNSAGWSRRR